MNQRADLYIVEELYNEVEKKAIFHNLKQTLAALPYMKEKHAGQVRKGEDKKPYIVHPLMIAKHAMAIGILDDAIIAAILLHDVVEDCDVSADELPVEKEAQEIVQLVSYTKLEGKTKEESKKVYYDKIAQNEKASMLKILDRCNNVSTMGMTFSKAKQREYMEETDKFVLPLVKKLMDQDSFYKDAAFVAQYQIISILNTIERLINE